MRYVLFNTDGSVVIESETAQGIANKARQGMFSMDCSLPAGHPNAYMAYKDQEGLCIGFPYRRREDAQGMAKRWTED